MPEEPPTKSEYRKDVVKECIGFVVGFTALSWLARFLAAQQILPVPSLTKISYTTLLTVGVAGAILNFLLKGVLTPIIQSEKFREE